MRPGLAPSSLVATPASQGTAVEVCRRILNTDPGVASADAVDKVSELPMKRPWDHRRETGKPGFGLHRAG
jgi:hypothetical protein